MTDKQMKAIVDKWTGKAVAASKRCQQPHLARVLYPSLWTCLRECLAEVLGRDPQTFLGTED